MSLLKQAVRGAGWSIAGGYISQFVAFGMFLVTSRLVGPAAFGAVAIALGIVELCRSFTTESIAANLVANPNAGKAEFSAAFVWTMSSTAVLTLLLSLLAPLLAHLFNTPALTSVLPQISLLLFGYGFQRLQEARLVKTMRFQMLSVRAIAAALIGGVVGIWFAMHQLGVQALVYQQWTSAFISAALLWGSSDWRPNLSFTGQQFITLQRANWALAPANIIYGLSVILDGLAVAVLAGPAAAGLYNLGKRVVVAMLMALSAALDRVSLATFAQLRDDLPRLASALNRALSLSMLVVFPFFIGIASITPELIALTMGPAWAGAAGPTAVLLGGAAIMIATCYLENAQLVLERRRWIVAQRVLFVCLLMLGIAIFGRFGSTAIALVAVTAMLAQNIAAAFTVSKILGSPLLLYLRNVAPPLVLSLFMAALVAAMRSEMASLSAFAKLALLAACGAAFYAATSFIAVRQSVAAFIRTAKSAA